MISTVTQKTHTADASMNSLTNIPEYWSPWSCLCHRRQATLDTWMAFQDGGIIIIPPPPVGGSDNPILVAHRPILRWHWWQCLGRWWSGNNFLWMDRWRLPSPLRMQFCQVIWRSTYYFFAPTAGLTKIFTSRANIQMAQRTATTSQNCRPRHLHIWSYVGTQNKMIPL